VFGLRVPVMPVVPQFLPIPMEIPPVMPDGLGILVEVRTILAERL